MKPLRPEKLFGTKQPRPDETPEERTARLREVDEFVADYNARLRAEGDMQPLAKRLGGGATCPQCGMPISGATRMTGSGRPAEVFILPGDPGLCAECGAFFIFTDEAGNVRLMSDAERTSPEYERAVATMTKAWTLLTALRHGRN